jgi:hypothetical protein
MSKMDGSLNICLIRNVYHKTILLPAKSRKLFLQCIFDSKQHPSAVAYLDAGRVKLFDTLFSQRFLQLYQQEVQASTRSQAKEPAIMI